MAHPCIGSSATIFRSRSSSVPCRRSGGRLMAASLANRYERLTPPLGKQGEPCSERARALLGACSEQLAENETPGAPWGAHRAFVERETDDYFLVLATVTGVTAA